MPVKVRAAAEADFEPLSRLDFSYPTGRYLALERSGDPPQLTFAFRWRAGPAGSRRYARYTREWFADASGRADLFLVGEARGRPIGLLIVRVLRRRRTGEITDLAVDAGQRRRGAGRALVEAASDWARARRLRALWAEPNADNYTAIEFYVRLGFRLSGFNDRMYSNAGDPGACTLYMYRELA